MSIEIRIADPPLALTDAEREHILAEAAGCGADRAEVALSGDGSGQPSHTHPLESTPK